jgi:hypothetical protein
MVMINPMMSVSRFDGADREGRRGAGLWRILRSQALSRDLQDQEPGLSETRNRVQPSRNSPDGNPPKVPRMGTLIRIGHPLFFLRPILEGNLIGPHSGPGPASLPTKRYGKRKRSIDAGVPFGEGVRLFLMGAVGLRMNEPSRRSTFMPGLHGGETTRTLSTSRVQDEGSQNVAPLRRWLR